jgi:hypothetical protein
MMEFEKRGVPTVSFTAETFVRDAHRSAESFGFPELPIAVVPLPFTNQSPEAVATMVDGSIDQVIAGLTTTVARTQPKSEIITVDEDWITIEGKSDLDALAEMNRLFLQYDWSDGFPLFAPTKEALDRMLTGTTRNPSEVIAILEPGFGKATVEKIAVACVMAGCRPEFLPVVIAAVEALADPHINLRNKAMSTGAAAALMWVNGPIAKRIGMNSGICALGPGSPSFANATIGRALHMCMMNIGQTYPGISDMDTIGTPCKFSMCVAENQDASYWDPYHVEHGYDKDESTVTVHFVYGICELFDLTSYKSDSLTDVFATAAKNAAQVCTGLWLIGRRADPRYGTDEKEEHTMFICPEHADIFKADGWSKEDIRRSMHAKSRLPFKLLMQSKERKAFDAVHPELAWLWDSPETMLPVVEDKDCYNLVVVGGTVGRGSFMWGSGAPVTKLIKT